MTRAHPATDRAHALHVEAVALASDWRTVTWRLARHLRGMEVDRQHEALGYASMREYAVESLGLEARQVRDLLCTARRLVGLPQLSAEVEAGRLAWSKAREIGRVATPETELAWIAHAKEVSTRRLEAEVAGVLFGEPPPSPGAEPKKPARVVLRFEMEASDAEILRQALALMQSRSDLDDEEFDQGAALAEIAHHLLATAPATEEAPTSGDFRIVLTQCPTCMRTDGLEHEITDTVADQAHCDPEIVEGRPGPDQGAAMRPVPDRLRRIVLHDFGWKCGVPTCENRWHLEIHHIRPWSLGGRHERRNLVPLCSLHHRLLHGGCLAVERLPDGSLAFERATGRVVTHVGRQPTVS